MTDKIITYEAIYEKLRNEKLKNELQDLNEDFFQHVIRYLEEKRKTLQSSESKNSIFAIENIAKTKKQIENIQKILSELYERREKKIIQLAITASRTNHPQDSSAMTFEEKKLYFDLVNKLNIYRKDILYNILSGKPPKITEDIEEDTNELKLIRFIEPVPKFIGDDLKTYGPFEQEEVANLPIRVSEVLIKNKRAEEM